MTTLSGSCGCLAEEGLPASRLAPDLPEGVKYNIGLFRYSDSFVFAIDPFFYGEEIEYKRIEEDRRGPKIRCRIARG